MVSFYFSVRSILIEDIVEDEVALWTEGVVSWIFIIRGSSQGTRVKDVDYAFRNCVNVL